MAKLRIQNRFGIIPNDLLNNENITFKAKGLFGYLQSKPENWDFAAGRIAKDTKDGEKATIAGLKELEVFGYLERKKYQNGKGHWEVEYILCENPTPQNRQQEAPSAENPVTENPVAENPVADNRQTNKERNTKKEIIKKNNISSEELKFPVSSFNYKVCKDFLEAHKKRKSISVMVMLGKKTEMEILQTWCDEIRKFLNIDNYTEEQIEKLLKFTYTKEQWVKQEDFNFWQNNLQSVMKFREKNKNNVRYFEFMIDKMKQNAPAVLAYYNQGAAMVDKGI